MHEIVQTFEVSYRYRVIFTRGAFRPENPCLRDVLASAGPGPHRLLPVVDSGVLAADPELPERVRAYAHEHSDQVELTGGPVAVRGGEICKTDPREVGELYRRMERDGICRHSFVLAIGGGAVLDAVGFAAATAHRGVRLVRMPTTVLAQNDAGIGVKNALNLSLASRDASHGRKNFIGTFQPPFAVLNDSLFLETLPARERRAGIAEAVKVALIRDAAFFEELYLQRDRLARHERPAMAAMITRCAELHLEHIRTSGDPFELGSARPLDFGHWVAHKLEELSGGGLRHGEAVAVGIALDSLYSHDQGQLGENDLLRILELLKRVGFDLAPPALAGLCVERALADFREHLGGALCITLLDGIGRGVEVERIDPAGMQKCIERLSEHARPEP